MEKLYIILLFFLGIFFGGRIGNAQQKQITVGNLSEETLDPSMHRYAFIVGNDHYEDPKINNLSSCRLDAVRFSGFLKSNQNWNLPSQHIKVLLDARKENFQKAFLKQLNGITIPEISTLYFYYSGHGVQGGIVPSNYKIDNTSTLISYDWIQQKIEEYQVNAVVFVIDACYSGSIINYKSEGFNQEYWNALKQDKENNKAVFTATNAFRVTPSGKHESEYTKHFLMAISQENTDSNKDGIITAGELFKGIEKETGEMNEPQFFGNVHFPMASSKEVVAGAYERFILGKKKNNVTNTLQDIITWRKQMEAIHFTENQASSEIKKLEENGSPEAYARIGFLYREGLGISKDINRAISYFVTAAEDGNGFAYYNLGYLYTNGIGFEKDTEKGLNYYKKSALKEDPFAQYNLGLLYSKENNGVCKTDPKKAEYWLKKASNYDMPFAFFSLGVLFYKKAEKTSTPTIKATLEKESFKWFLKAATNHHPRAQIEIAKSYEEGKGINKNQLLAKHWLKKACKNNELQACRKLIYLNEKTQLSSN